jgi:hypothetical protein
MIHLTNISINTLTECIIDAEMALGMTMKQPLSCHTHTHILCSCVKENGR